MNIDVNELALGNLLNYSNYLQSQGHKAHILVYATEIFLKENPCMRNAVQGKENSQDGVGYCVLNISDTAVRNLHREHNHLVFDTRFNGVEQRMFVLLGDIFALTSPTENIMLDPCAVLLAQTSTTLLLRPYSSLNPGDIFQPVESEQPSQESKPRPTLTVVKS